MYFYFPTLLTDFFGLISVKFYQQIQNYFKLLYVKIHNNLHFTAALVRGFFLFICNISASEEMLFLMGPFCVPLHLFYSSMPDL